MNIFVYEWVVGGGFLDRAETPPDSLRREGAVMLAAVAKDYEKLSGVRVNTILAEGIGPLPFVAGMPAIESVRSASERDTSFDALVQHADATIIIAPEFEGILLGLVGRVEQLGGKLLSPGAELVEIASDKQTTAERLYAGGIKVPQGMVIMPGEMCPAGFDYPAVLKPVAGAGSLGIMMLAGPEKAPEEFGAYRLEPVIDGQPVSVSFLCGTEQTICLEPCTQRIVGKGDFGYLGGAIPLVGSYRERALRLGQRAIEVLPKSIGYVGVDIVLGAAADGSDDFVIEVNPRHTTSYVGIRSATDANLGELVLMLAAGQTVRPPKFTRSLEFKATGEVHLI